MSNVCLCLLECTNVQNRFQFYCCQARRGHTGSLSMKHLIGGTGCVASESICSPDWQNNDEFSLKLLGLLLLKRSLSMVPYPCSDTLASVCLLVDCHRSWLGENGSIVRTVHQNNCQRSGRQLNVTLIALQRWRCKNVESCVFFSIYGRAKVLWYSVLLVLARQLHFTAQLTSKGRPGSNGSERVRS